MLKTHSISPQHDKVCGLNHACAQAEQNYDPKSTRLQGFPPLKLSEMTGLSPNVGYLSFMRCL